MVVGSAVQDPTGAPIRWEDPPEPELSYMFDPMHFPYPLSPLFQTTFGSALAVGFTAAMRELRAPVALKVCYRNGYFFGASEFAQPSDEAEARKQAAAAEAAMTVELDRLEERWRDEHLPRIERHLRRIAAMEIETAPAAEAAAMLDELAEIHCDLWTIHFLIVTPMTLGMQLFDEFYADLFGGAESDAHALIVGLPSESINAAIGLSDLAVATREAGLDRLILETPDDDLASKLGESEAGRRFAQQVERYLEAYGLRQDLFDLATPTWREHPSYALAAVRGYLRSGYDARAAHADTARSAAAAIEAAREHLAAYPEAVRGRFEGLLQVARTSHFLQEEHNFYIDQQALALTRLLFVRLGRRLAAAGTIDTAEDVFALTNDEVQAVLADPAGPERAVALRESVRARGEELRWARSLTPPPFIGAPPTASPADNPMARGNERFWGAPPPPAAAPNELTGNAGSRGTASGRARVALTLEAAAALEPGEILVAITTMPPWTPLFGVAAAVVTETGGPLSHCAIVAREYGIPAVVGAHGATRTIRTGQRITVDGSRGVVTLDGTDAG
jgi:pyruvate,water dikinase